MKRRLLILAHSTEAYRRKIRPFTNNKNTRQKQHASAKILRGFPRKENLNSGVSENSKKPDLSCVHTRSIRPIRKHICLHMLYAYLFTCVVCTMFVEPPRVFCDRWRRVSPLRCGERSPLCGMADRNMFVLICFFFFLIMSFSGFDWLVFFLIVCIWICKKKIKLC